MTARTPTPTLYLVDDEDVTLRVNGHEEAFRLRIWRTEGEPALVLVSQLPGFVSPSRASERLVNVVKSVWLAHNERGMFYFELAGDDLYGVTFLAMGQGDRSRLYKPKYHKVGRNFIDEYVGYHVEA